MNTEVRRKSPWPDLIALLLAFSAAIITFLGAMLTYLSQAQIASAPLWPLPGLVLVDWTLLGSIGFVTAFFSLRKKTAGWFRMTWIITGTFIPIAILGAFSIGMVVIISFLLFVFSTVIIALRYREKWLESFGLLMLGSLGNLAILMAIITLSNQTF
jgi:hypothetical protein